MIGDSPSTDIKGGNNANLTTILVKTGNYKEGKELKDDE